MSEAGGITAGNTTGQSGNLPSANAGQDFTARLDNFVTEMRGRLSSPSASTAQPTPAQPEATPAGTASYPASETSGTTTPQGTSASQAENYTPASETSLPASESSGTTTPAETTTPETASASAQTGDAASGSQNALPAEQTSQEIPANATSGTKATSTLPASQQPQTPTETEAAAQAPASSQNQPAATEQPSGTTAPQQREYYTDVVDANKNGIFDQDDIASVVYDKEVISTELANRSERIIMMGEDHADQPLDTIEATIKKIAAKGKPVIYTIELSSEYLSANGPDLIERLNKGEITPEEFETRFVRHLEQAYGSDIAIDPKDVATTIVRMHKAGAKIVPVDDGYKDVIDQAKANNTDDVSKVTGINRDEIMANNIIDLYNENPDATIISSLGGAHAQANVNIENNFGSTDAKNPVGTRLISALGRKEVLSVYNYQTQSSKDYEYYDLVSDVYLNGKYGKDVAYDTWDMYIPANGS